jgi:hypothetical protein
LVLLHRCCRALILPFLIATAARGTDRNGYGRRDLLGPIYGWFTEDLGNAGESRSGKRAATLPLLITGQNPHSSGPAAKTLMAALKQRKDDMKKN